VVAESRIIFVNDQSAPQFFNVEIKIGVRFCSDGFQVCRFFDGVVAKLAARVTFDSDSESVYLVAYINTH
jgi:hypothetical protein